MIPLTRAQRVALFKVFQRDYPSWVSPGKRRTAGGTLTPVTTWRWRQFRESVKPSFDGSGCVMLPWKGMWLGIELDGYVHS